MTELLAAIGIVIAVFLVLSAAVEAVVEVLRGFTGKAFPSLNGAISLNEALQQAQAFAPANAPLQARLDAIKLAADRIGADVTAHLTAAKNVLNTVSGTLGEGQAAQLSERINEAANQVTKAIGDHERHRILIVRLVSGVIGIGIAFLADVNAFEFLTVGTNATNPFRGLAISPDLAKILTGLSAAGGSSYWHDKLDKVRSAKTLSEQLAGLRS